MNGLTKMRGVAALAVASVALGAAASADAATRPDLSVAALGGVPSSAAPGATLTLKFSVANGGRGRAGATRVAALLSRDGVRGRGDVALGSAKVAALGPRRKAAGRLRVAVPAREGGWRVLVCADGGGTLREASERNNCRASAALVVRASGGAPAPAGGGASAPSGGGTPSPSPTPSPPPSPSPEPGPDPAPVHVAPAPPAAAPLRAVAVTADAPQHVVRFRVDAPGTLLSDVAVSGLQAGETITDLDVRPRTGKVVATTSASRVLTLDPGTGAAAPTLPAAFAAAPLGQDVDPVADRLHAAAGDRHLRHDLATGASAELSRLAYVAGDAHAGQTPAIASLAYTDAWAGALAARLYGVDAGTHALVEVTDEARGLVRTVGPLGAAGGVLAGFDVAGAGPRQQAYALLEPAAGRSSLYRVDLATGAATPAGAVGSAGRFTGLALVAAADDGPPASGIQASSDGWSEGSAAIEAATLPLDRLTVCPADQPYRQLGLATALADARAFLRDRAGQGALDAFAASPVAGDALQSVGAAAVAVSQGEPGAALAALLRAHELEPADPTILLNAGGVAASLGLGSEALAMIRAAEAGPAPARSPMGLSWTGRVQLAYAHAYVSLSQWDNAETAALAGRAHEPDLASEAAGDLAAVALCRDDDVSQAAQRRLRQRVRNASPTPLDDSRGQTTEMREIPLPALPENAAADQPFYDALASKVDGEAQANATRRQALRDALDDSGAEPAVRRRREGVVERALAVVEDADVRALDAAGEDAIHAAQQVHDDFFGTTGTLNDLTEQAADACEGQGEACFDDELRSRCKPAMNQAHSAWLDAVGEAYDADRTRIALVSRRMSGYAANLADRATVDYVLAEIEGDEIRAASSIVARARVWSVAVHVVEEHCVDAPQPAGEPSPDAPQATGPTCPPDLKGFAVKTEILSGVTEDATPYALGIKANCEEVEVEGSVTPLPFLNAFSSVNYSLKSGETTLVVGSKAALGGTPLAADFQSGVYVKFDAKGGFQDVGWRTGPTLTAGNSIAEYSAGDTMDLSFVQGVKFMAADQPG